MDSREERRAARLAAAAERTEEQILTAYGESALNELRRGAEIDMGEVNRLKSNYGFSIGSITSILERQQSTLPPELPEELADETVEEPVIKTLEEIQEIKGRLFEFIDNEETRDLKAYYDLIDRNGVIDALIREFWNLKMTNEDFFINDLLPILIRCIPKNFLIDNIEEIVANKNDKSEPANREEDYITHVTTDKNLETILRNGGIRPQSETGAKGAGTSSLELHLGLNGLFTSYCYEYEHISYENTLVFPAGLVDEPKSVSIWGELNYSGHFFEDNHGLSEFLEKRLSLKHLYCPELTGEQLIQFIICVLMYMQYETILHPNELEAHEVYEVVIPLDCLPRPILIVVNEDDEYDEELSQFSAESDYRDVPIISRVKIREQLESIGQTYDDDTELLAPFLKAVREGALKI